MNEATPTIAIPFSIGEELWRAVSTNNVQHVVCPECAGTKVLTIIKGNGEQVSVGCDLCSWGFEPPHGWIEKCDRAFQPVKFIPRRIDIRVDVFGEKFMYSEDSPDASCCILVNEAEEKAKRDIHVLASKRESLAFSVSYWSRELKESERRVEVARARLAVCKTKDYASTAI